MVILQLHEDLGISSDRAPLRAGPARAPPGPVGYRRLTTDQQPEVLPLPPEGLPDAYLNQPEDPLVRADCPVPAVPIRLGL
jgi:hypothetical protein